MEQLKYIVGLSGGIDSEAALLWAIQTHGKENVIALNADPGGNEHPMTTEHLQEFSEKCHPVVTCRATFRDMFAKEETVINRGFDPNAIVSFGDLAKIRGRFPSRKAQFCTELLKLRPSLRWMKENITGPYERVTGLRRQESDKRSETPEREWDDWFDCWANHPLAHWDKQRCFDFVLAEGWPINPLYSLGFTRVGCAPCINSSRADIRQWNKRFPEMIEKVRGWEVKSGRAFFPPMIPESDEFVAAHTNWRKRFGHTEMQITEDGEAIDVWVMNDDAPPEPKFMNFIEEVVAWANCEHGGKQFSLDVWTPAPVCESKFGLCE